MDEERRIRRGLLFAFRLACAGVVALLAAAFVSSLPRVFASASSPTPSPDTKLTLHVGWVIEPDSLNPFVMQETTSYEIAYLNYDTLVRYDPATLEPRPALAKSWSHSPDGKIWTFNLREGVTWQDGRLFTAKDVVFTFNYVIKNDPANYTMFTTNIDKVVAVDDYAVRFTCAKPKANMLSLPVPIVPEHIWSRIPGRSASTSYVNAAPIVGTGTFQTAEVKKGRFVRMEANERYWRGAPKIDEIIFETYTNAESMTADLRAGNLQTAMNIPLALIPQINSTPGLKVIAADPFRDVEDLGFNCYEGAASKGNPVLKDAAFRRALNYAIDKEKLVQVAYHGYAVPAATIIIADYYKDPDWSWQPPAGSEYTFDPEKAKAALDAAGYKDTNGDGIRDYKGTPIELRLAAMTAYPEYVVVGKLIAGWMGKIGLKVKLEVVDEGALMDKMWSYEGDAFAPDFDMFLWGWSGDPDPTFVLSVFTAGQIECWSDCNWSNAEYDRLYEQQSTTLDPKARQAIIWKMQEIMYRESPEIFTVAPQTAYAYDVGHWTGWVRSPAGTGQAIGTQYVMDSYLSVRPKEGGGSGGGGRGVSPWVAVVAIAVAAVVAAIWYRRRKRHRAVEET